MSALSRVAVDNHKHISVEHGDTVVLSSRIIPGNEKAIFRMIDHMARRGADVIYGRMNPPLHVSGHGSVEEMKLVLNLVRPRYFMPIHGEYRQLAKHAPLAEHLRCAGLEETFVMESGEMLEIDQHGARKAGKVHVGRVCIDSGLGGRSGGGDGDSRPPASFRRRHRAAHHRHQQTPGKSESLPEIVSRGFMSLEDGSEFIAGSPPGGGARRWRIHQRGEDRLGRDEGKDPRRPEALHRARRRRGVR